MPERREGDVGEHRTDEPSDERPGHQRTWPILVFEWLIVGPLFLWLWFEFASNPEPFLDWRVIVWAAAITVVDLLPVQGSSSMAFSLSFPIELSAALIYPAPVAALIAFLGTADEREIRRELPVLKALYIRGQIAWSVALEAVIFHRMASLESGWLLMGAAVLIAAMAGYVLNVLIVATYAHLQSGESMESIVREMHLGVFGEFVVSYMGLALFSVLVAISTQSEGIGLFALVVFIAPLAFARQMFQRTHSLQVATEELAERQAENEYQALHDSLTGLPNRVLFHQAVSEALVAAKASGSGVAVMLLDLDHFKEINDTLGHHFGDQLLRQIGPELSRSLREGDVMARLGGDEFGILLADLPTVDMADTVAHRLMEDLHEPVTVEGLALDVAGSLGAAFFPSHGVDADSLLRHADVAMYSAKEAGLTYDHYDPDMDIHSPGRLRLAGQVRHAIEADELLVYYQPKVRMSDGRVSGAEALVRWQHPELGMLEPDDFIPLVEKTVLLRPLTLYVIERVLNDWTAWAENGTRLPVSVNLSPRSLVDLQLPADIADLVGTHDVPPAFIRLELTESFLMTETGRSGVVLDELSDLGFGLSIDDFGTGYSSLSHLRRLPIDEVKVDRSFVSQMNVSSNDHVIVRAMIDLGRQPRRTDRGRRGRGPRNVRSARGSRM